jgi:site-specific DNA-methyltransferase (adenine-specific)
MTPYLETENVELYHGDCLEVMPELSSPRLILTDPPYGTTQCKWDVVIPFEPMWECIEMITPPDVAVVLMASQPFTSLLVSSNLSYFKYSLVWEKTTASGHLNAKKMPMRSHEDIAVFYDKLPTYNPIKTKGHIRKTARRVNRGDKMSPVYGDQKGITSYDSTERYPRSVIKTTTDKQKSKLHPTQKPVVLMEYLIKTYTNEGDTVLDFSMGSGTTGIACLNLGRNFIGIEKKEKWCKVAADRIIHHNSTSDVALKNQ